MKQHTASNIVFKSDLSTRARIVFMYLSYRSNKENTCFPSIKTISKECGMGISTVKRALNDLCDEDYVKKDPRFRDDNGQTSNLYTLADEVPTGDVHHELEGQPIEVSKENLYEPQKTGGAILRPCENKNLHSLEGKANLMSNPIHSYKGVQFDPLSLKCNNREQCIDRLTTGHINCCQIGEPPPGSNKYSHELVKANP